MKGWIDNLNSKVIKDDRGQWNHPGKITEINSNNITMKGVPYPVLGISDTGDKKLMQPNGEYKFKGKKVTEYPMMQYGGQITDDVQQFHMDYVNSPKYKERLTKSNYENVPEEIKKRYENLKNIDINYEYPSKLKQFVTGRTPGHGSYYDVEDNRLNLDYIKDTKVLSDLYPGFAKPYQREIEAHELGHTQIRPNQNTNDVSRLNEYDNHQLFDRLKPEQGLNTEEHDRMPTELKADLDAYRYMLYKSGKYDAGKQDFKKEHLKGSKKTFVKDRLQSQYSDKDIIWLMNNIADNKDSDNIAKAQNGMALSSKFENIVPGALSLIPENLRNSGIKKEDVRKESDVVKIKSSLNEGETNYVRTTKSIKGLEKRPKEIEQLAATDFVNWYSDPATKEKFTKNTGLDSARLQDFIGKGLRTPMMEAETNEDISVLSQMGANAVYNSPYVIQNSGRDLNKYVGEIRYQGQRESTSYSKAPDMRNVLGHEITHASHIDAVLAPALNRILGDVNKQTKGTFKRDREYLAHPEEAYGNFHMFRKNLGLKPGQKVDEKQLQKLVKEKGLDEEIFYKAYDDDKIVKAINTIAYNKGNQQSNAGYAKNGKNLVNFDTKSDWLSKY